MLTYQGALGELILNKKLLKQLYQDTVSLLSLLP